MDVLESIAVVIGAAVMLGTMLFFFYLALGPGEQGRDDET